LSSKLKTHQPPQQNLKINIIYEDIQL